MTEKLTYIYPAIFLYEGSEIVITFPDFAGAFTTAYSEEEALEMARECLGLHIHGMEEDGDVIPDPTPASVLKMENPSHVIVLIDVWMKRFRSDPDKAVKKTLTIPQWLDNIAVERNVNFSQVLKNALIEYLEIDEADRK